MNTLKVLIFIFSILINFLSFGQKKNSKVKEINSFLKQSSYFASQNKFDSANFYSDKAKFLLKNTNDISLRARVKYNNAKILYWQAKTPEAKTILQQNISNHNLSDSLKIRSLCLMAEILKYENNDSESLNNYVKVEKIVRNNNIYTLKDSSVMNFISLRMGFLHEKANNIEKALSYYDNALLYCGNDSECRNVVMYVKSIVYDKKKGFRETIKHSLEGIKISTKNKFNIYLPSYYLFISNAYLSLKKGDSAIYYGKKGLDDNNHCRRELLFNNIGKGHVLQKNYKESIVFFEKALGHSSEKQGVEIHKNIRDAYILMKNYKKAVYHNEVYLTLKKTEDSLQVRQQLLEITEKYDSKKNKLEIKMLQSENDYNDTIIKKKNNQILLICASLILLSTFLIFIIFSYSKQKKHKNILFVKNRQLAQKLKNNDISLSNKHKPKKAESLNIDIVQKEKIKNFISNAIEQEFYLNKNISLVLLAKKANTNTTYLSKVINEDYQKPFALFINELRISNTLKKLETIPNYKNLTIENIADKAGFSSSSAFYNAFKKFTGLTPSYYIKKRLLLDNLV